MCRTLANVSLLIALAMLLGCARATPPAPAAPGGTSGTSPAGGTTAVAEPSVGTEAISVTDARDGSTPAIDPVSNPTGAVAGAPSARGFDSPDAAFAAMQDALKNKDWRAAVACMTDESQEGMSTILLLAGGLMAAFAGDQAADLNAVLKKHGASTPEPAFNLSALATGGSPDSDTETPADPAADVPEIKDKAGFIADMLAVLEKMNRAPGMAKQEQWAAATLGEVVLDGDNATASISIPGDEGEAKNQPISFRKGDAGWLIHISESDFGMGPGGPGGGFSAIQDFNEPPAGPLTETVLEGGLTSTLGLSFEQPFTSQFFGQEFPERTVYATLNLAGEPIMNTYEYGEFQVESITDDTGRNLELAAPVKDQFDHEIATEFVELSDFFLDKKDTLPIVFAITAPAGDAKSLSIHASCKLKVRESIMVKDVVPSLGAELKDERLSKLGTFTVQKPEDGDEGLVLVVQASEGTVEGVKLLNGDGEPLDTVGTFQSGFGSEVTFGVMTSEKLPADTQMRIMLGGTESIQVVPLTIDGAELP